MLFRFQIRDGIRAVLFAIIIAYVLPAILSGAHFAGSFLGALVVGLVLSVGFLVGGSTICHGVRNWAKKPELESKLMAVWFVLLSAWTAVLLVVVAHALPCVFTVTSWDSAIAGGFILSAVAAITATNEPRK